MENYNILDDIAKRTGGDIYIGVVGPVRTGKSTFIKNFMDNLVIPNISDSFQKERAKDELPQSAAGKTIMTTEPKFIPNEAVPIRTKDNISCSVRLIDCVGYVIPDALGHIEEDEPRMVSTPWEKDPIPFTQAAETGTHKVICEHSTIGLIVTTDGSVADIERSKYEEAEMRVVNELKEIGKPFIVLLNCENPYSPEATSLRNELEERYKVPVMPINCKTMTENEIMMVLSTVLSQFPLKQIEYKFPGWIQALSSQSPLKSKIYKALRESVSSVEKIYDASASATHMNQFDFIKDAHICESNPGEGKVLVSVTMADNLFYETLSENAGMEIADDKALVKILCELSNAKKKYDRIAYALSEVDRKGYGIVFPDIEELSLEEPEIIKQGNKFGVRLKASAPSIHLIRADIETEVSPIVGTEKQSEELVHYLLKEFEVDPKKIWESDIFGKSLHELINEGLHNKLSRMPEDAQMKLAETLQKIINEGSGGLICIIL